MLSCVAEAEATTPETPACLSPLIIVDNNARQVDESSSQGSIEGFQFPHDKRAGNGSDAVCEFAETLAMPDQTDSNLRIRYLGYAFQRRNGFVDAGTDFSGAMAARTNGWCT